MTHTTEPPALRVLLVEDEDAHAELIAHHLDRCGPESHYELTRCATLEQASAELATEAEAFAVALVDMNLPDSRGPETLAAVLDAAPQLPVIVLTVLDDRETGIAMVRHGAADFLSKQNLSADLLDRSIRYALERRRQTDHLRRANAELARSNEDLEQFAHVAAHELKNSLWILAYVLDLVQDQEGAALDGEAHRALQDGKEAVAQARRAIDGLLAYAKANYRGRRPKPVSAADALGRAIDSLRAAIDEHGVTITCDPLPQVLGDADLITHLLRNLLENAIKYRAQRAQRIHVDARSQGTEWVIRVSDQGMGIDPRHTRRIFNLFDRGAAAASTDGAGVGLAICKRIVTMHGGRIWVESRVNEGSTFFFTLPMPTAQAAPDAARAAPREVARSTV